MGDTTEIAWCDATFNPWIGCQKVAAGCRSCYAEAFAKRYGKAEWGPGGTRVKTSEANWRKPLKWNREAEASGVRKRVFCASLADVFEDWDGWILDHNGETVFEPTGNITRIRLKAMGDLRRDLFALIDATPLIDWLLLTKRPENIRRMWPIEPAGYREAPLPTLPPLPVSRRLFRPNVWLGTSIAEQADAERNLVHLEGLDDLAPIRFLSCEPMIGPLDFSMRKDGTGGSALSFAGINWVIAGGESGPSSRPMISSWAYDLRDQCVAAGVPFFFKQFGEWADAGCREFGQIHSGEIRHARSDGSWWPRDGVPSDENADVITMRRIGNKAAGRDLGDREWNEFPEVAHAAR